MNVQQSRCKRFAWIATLCDIGGQLSRWDFQNRPAIPVQTDQIHSENNRLKQFMLMLLFERDTAAVQNVALF